MKRVMIGYYCSGCGKNIPESEVKTVGTIGKMHFVVGEECRSGRVAPVWREQGDS